MSRRFSLMKCATSGERAYKRGQPLLVQLLVALPLGQHVRLRLVAIRQMSERGDQAAKLERVRMLCADARTRGARCLRPRMRGYSRGSIGKRCS